MGVVDVGRGDGAYRLPKPAKEASQGMMMTMMKSKRKQNCSSAETGTGAEAGAEVSGGAGRRGRGKEAEGRRQEAAAPSTAERMTETCFAERMRLWAIGV